jgi:uncharacterized protein
VLARLLERFAPHEVMSSVLDLAPAVLTERGLGAVVFDVDNTLGPWGVDEPVDEIHGLLAALQQHGIRMAFLSNHAIPRTQLERRLPYGPVVWDAKKPRFSGYRTALREISARPERSAMVGDRLVTDVWGARVLGMYTYLVDPIIGHGVTEGLVLRTTRACERALVRMHVQLRRTSPRRP